MARAKKGPVTFQVTCPTCQTRLTVDTEVKAIVAHDPPPKTTGPMSTLDGAVAALRGAGARREAIFQEAAEAEKTRGDVLSRKLGEALKRAKDSPDPPPRPFGYD